MKPILCVALFLFALPVQASSGTRLSPLSPNESAWERGKLAMLSLEATLLSPILFQKQSLVSGLFPRARSQENPYSNIWLTAKKAGTVQVNAQCFSAVWRSFGKCETVLRFNEDNSSKFQLLITAPTQAMSGK